MKCALCLLAGLLVDAVTAFEGTYLCQEDLLRVANTPGTAQRSVLRADRFLARGPVPVGAKPAPPAPPVQPAGRPGRP